LFSQHPRRSRLIPALSVFFLILSAGLTVRAASLEETGAPPELAAWEKWASYNLLYGPESSYLSICPKMPGRSTSYCAWSGTLNADLTESGGTFEITWLIFRPQAVRLPGGNGSWPETVTVQTGSQPPRREAVIFEPGRSDVPLIYLEPGQHTVRGRWTWPRLPQALNLPLGPITKVIVSGREKTFGHREINYNEQGVNFWLTDPSESPQPVKTQPDTPAEADQLKVSIDRLITDEQPMTAETWLKLTVSGRNREVFLDNVLLPESIPTSLSSPLPARLSGRGIRVQVRPGIHSIRLNARLEGPVSRLGPAGGDYGPENWALRLVPALRQVTVSGAPQVDASQVDIPWKNYPVYSLEPGQSLTFETLRRGDPDPGPDQLVLNRRCWLDYDGQGLSCRDNLQGTMKRSWHLSVDPPLVLGQASISGQPQVLTWQTNSKGQRAPGLQVRQTSLYAEADLRLPHFTGLLPASGWDHDLTSTVQQLTLPPGYKVFRVQGAKVSDPRGQPIAFTDRWTTLDLFLVLIIFLACVRFRGWALGAAALAAMVLSYHEYSSPKLVFVHLLACIALLKVLPQESAVRTMVRTWFFAAALFLIFTSAVFAIHQVRTAMYPQLDQPSGTGHLYRKDGSFFAAEDTGARTYGYSPEEDYAAEEMAMPAPSEAVPPPPRNLTQSVRMASPRAKSLPAGAARQAETQLQSDSQPVLQSSLTIPNPEAKVQNSLARPSWDWQTVVLDYNGQVTAGQTVTINLIPPAAAKILGLARVILMIILVLGLLDLKKIRSNLKNASAAKDPDGPAGNEGAGAAPAAAALGLALFLAVSALTLPAQAQEQSSSIPSSEMLEELTRRLVQNPRADFSPSIPEMIITPGEGTLKMTFRAESPARLPFVLPQLDSNIFQAARLALVSSPGQSSGQSSGQPLMLHLPNQDQALVLVPEGISVFTYEGLFLKTDSFQIDLSVLSKPRKVILDSDSWSISGLNEQGYPAGGALFLTRKTAAGPPEAPKSSEAAAAGDSADPETADPETEVSGAAAEPVLAEPETDGSGEAAEPDPAEPEASLSADPPAGLPPDSAGTAGPVLDRAAGREVIAPFFDVSRVLSLGLEWEVITTVTLTAPLDYPVTLKLPLLKGENPTSQALQMQNGEAILNFSPARRQISFTSSLRQSPEPLVLEAGRGNYTETWILDPASLWAVKPEGLNPVYNVSPAGFWNPSWRPWPGEKLTVTVTRPEPVPGTYLVADSAALEITLGLENRKMDLEFSFRSSLGGLHTFRLPPGAQIQTLFLDSRSLPVSSAQAQSGPEVSLPLSPGTHQVKVSWLMTEPLRSLTRSSLLDLGLQTSNIRLTMHVPEDRWILLAGGPVQGPAVLFWSLAGAILILAALLSRVKLAPLGILAWFLLLLGLSQYSLAAAFPAAGWLLVLGLRAKKNLKTPVFFNLSQIGLALWTLLALYLIYSGLKYGLLEKPDMYVTGNGSGSHTLNWFQDRTDGPWPSAWLLSLPESVYRYMMLAWALWLAWSVIRWLIWGWKCFSARDLWMKLPERPKKAKPPVVLPKLKTKGRPAGGDSPASEEALPPEAGPDSPASPEAGPDSPAPPEAAPAAAGDEPASPGDLPGDSKKLAGGPPEKPEG
jgi:hypothetical protein